MTTATLEGIVNQGRSKPAGANDAYAVLKQQLESNKREFLPLLGTMTNVDRFVRVVLTAVSQTPDLLSANRRSLVTACMKAASDGLMPDGRDAVLNVYNTKIKDHDSGREQWVRMAQYLPMVGGMVRKLYESGDVLMVDSAAVYERDRFVYRRGDNPSIEHEPSAADNPGEVRAAYVVVKLRNGEVKREVMWHRDIERVRAMSKAGTGESAPWVKWYDQQAIKSVIKRAAKQLPKADAFERIVAHDNEAIGLAAPSGSEAGLGAILTPSSNQGDAAVGAPDAPALGFDPSETLDQWSGAPAQASEQHVVVSTDAPAAGTRASKGRQRASASSPSMPPAPAPVESNPTYAELVEELKRAGQDDDAIGLVLDRARTALPSDQYVELVRLTEQPLTRE